MGLLPNADGVKEAGRIEGEARPGQLSTLAIGLYLS